MTHTHHVYHSLQRLTAVVILLRLGVACIFGQSAGEESPFTLRQHCTMIGAGTANILETYLSPYEYTGEHASIGYEYLRPLRILRTDDAHPRVHLQQLVRADGAHVQNPARNITEWAGEIDYSIAWYYTLTQSILRSNISLYTGPMISAKLGCIYNEHDGNNPAQAKAGLSLDWTARLTLPFHLLQRKATLRYTLSAPLLGASFSPAYGQSYYEIFSLGQYDHNVVFTHPFNMPSMHHLLTVDLPMRPSRSATCLRVGLAADYTQSHLNGLKYHNYSYTVLVGITRTFWRM